MNLHLRIGAAQLLDVSVDGDELDLREAGVDHPIDRVQPGAADADDADHRDVLAGVRRGNAVKPRRGLGRRLDPTHRSLLALRRRLLGGCLLWGLDRRRLPVHEVGDVRNGLLDRLLRLLAGRLLLRLPLLLRGLGRPEELRERALTHAGALARH